MKTQNRKNPLNRHGQKRGPILKLSTEFLFSFFPHNKGPIYLLIPPLMSLACSRPANFNTLESLNSSGTDAPKIPPIESTEKGPQKEEEAKPSSEDNYIVVLKKDYLQKSISAFSKLSPLTHESIFKLQENFVRAELSNIEKKFELQESLIHFHSAIQGGLYKMTPQELAQLKTDPRVAYVEKDQAVSLIRNDSKVEKNLGDLETKSIESLAPLSSEIQPSSIQNSPPWGLDRIDQQNLPLSRNYSSELDGTGVNAYVIDTGILTQHEEFEGRAESGFDFVDNDSDATDCNGHGSHVAGTIGGKTYGVAKKAKLTAVRVLDCGGGGTYSSVIAGVDWVTAHHKKPAVANMSLGGPLSKALEDAIRNSIQAGVTYTLAAGNENQDACATSPARMSEAIKAGATDSGDARANFSNYGTCVDIFAPGVDIDSVGITSVTATDRMSGTSMASPHVAGVVALQLQNNPSLKPDQIKINLLNGSLPGKVLKPGVGSPNKLLYMGFLNSSSPTPTPTPPSNQLVNGSILRNLSAKKGSELTFTISIPVNTQVLTVETLEGTPDADLYVKKGSAPTLASYDCRPFKNGNAEKCTFNQASSAVYFIKIRAFSDFSGLTLKVLYK